MPDARLSALDASFLAAETSNAHMHVGWAAICDPPADGPSPSFEELRDHIASRLARAPRYRQRLADVPFGIADPVWVDEDRFDIARHVLRAGGSTLDSIAAFRDRMAFELIVRDGVVPAKVSGPRRKSK